QAWGDVPVSSSFWGVGFRPAEILKRITLSAVVGLTRPAAHGGMAQQPNPFAKPADEAKPDPIPEFKLDRVLPTIPIPHDRPAFNFQMVDASLHHRDNQAIWVLNFRFKPLRIKSIDLPGKGRRQIHYLYYKVVNRTGKPR